MAESLLALSGGGRGFLQFRFKGLPRPGEALKLPCLLFQRVLKLGAPGFSFFQHGPYFTGFGFFILNRRSGAADQDQTVPGFIFLLFKQF